MIVPFLGGVVSSTITVTELYADDAGLRAWLAEHNCLVYAIDYDLADPDGSRSYRIFHATLRH